MAYCGYVNVDLNYTETVAGKLKKKTHSESAYDIPSQIVKKKSELCDRNCEKIYIQKTLRWEKIIMITILLNTKQHLYIVNTKKKSQ